MKKSKIIIPALGMLVMSTAATVTGTVAWFSMNKQVTASGMKVKAKAEGSIVITTGTLPVLSTKSTDVSLATTNATELYASTHDGDYTTYEYGLKRVTNAEIINPETGIRKNSTSTYTYGTIENSESNTYYKDFVVYIAGDGQGFSNQDIVISLTSSATNINKAISVDFYGQSVESDASWDCTSDNYLGTLNIAGVKNNADGKSVQTGKTTFEAEGIDIDQSTEDGTAAYSITMRVYFDGALIETGGSNDYTTYTSCGASDTAEAGKYYYSDNVGSSVATVATGASVAGLYKVSTTNTFAYARTNAVAYIADVTLKAVFAVKDND